MLERKKKKKKQPNRYFRECLNSKDQEGLSEKVTLMLLAEWKEIIY